MGKVWSIIGLSLMHARTVVSAVHRTCNITQAIPVEGYMYNHEQVVIMANCGM